VIPYPAPFPEQSAFTAVFLSWFLAQLIKLVFNGFREKRFNLRWLFDTGGMPSAHSATVSSLATVVGLYFGFNSIIFLAVLIFTVITMFDAAGVRRNVGKQARILNRIMEDVQHGGHVQEQKLKELLGHTPVEVFAGAFLGIAIGYLFCGVG
jgi:acid phosphatase family membrane protein YuiD